MYESVVFVDMFVAQNLQADADTIIISLGSPDEPARLADGWRGVLRLEFDDFCEEVLGVPIGSIPDVAREGYLLQPFFGSTYRLPDAIHAKKIIDFLAQHEGGCCDFVRVIVHCAHGKSRSAAVAEYVKYRYSVPILNSEPYSEWQDRVSMPDTSRANQRLLRLLKKWSDPYYDPILRAAKDEYQEKCRADVRAGVRTQESMSLFSREIMKSIKVEDIGMDGFDDILPKEE